MPAERRIAELAASGHRNPEITATLYISVKTVESQSDPDLPQTRGTQSS